VKFLKLAAGAGRQIDDQLGTQGAYGVGIIMMSYLTRRALTRAHTSAKAHFLTCTFSPTLPNNFTNIHSQYILFIVSKNTYLSILEKWKIDSCPDPDQFQNVIDCSVSRGLSKLHEHSLATFWVILLMSKTPYLSMLEKWKTDPGSMSRYRSVPKSNRFISGRRLIQTQNFMKFGPQLFE